MENCGGPQERCGVLGRILTGIIVLIEGHSGTSCAEIKRMLSLCQEPVHEGDYMTAAGFTR